MGQPEAKEAESKEIERKAAINKMLSENRIYGFCRTQHPDYPEFRMPNPPQVALLNAWKNPSKKVFCFTGGNRSGKTTIGLIVSLSVLFGEWLWNGEKIPFIHNEPRKVRVISQGWETHAKQVIEPGLRYWWPKSRPLETKKNNQGIDAVWIDKRSKSQLEILSNSQETDVHEGAKMDLVWYDEPPRRDIRISNARGLVDRQGRELITATLLKEAWLWREVIKAKLPDGSLDTSVYAIDANSYDNVGYGITAEGLEQFKRTLRPDEIESRINGKPSFMSTLVLPEFDRAIHIREPFTVPLDWVVDIALDYHSVKPWAVLFMATDRKGFKYFIDEIWENGSPKEIAEKIIRKIRNNNYRVNKIIVDPLAKATDNIGVDDVYAMLGNVLGPYGYSIQTASKDKDSGITLMRNYLMPENKMPALFVFKNCIMTATQMEDWVWDADTGKVSKKEDDMVENAYRLMLLQTEWYDEFKINSSASKSVIL
jgi:hypothetical protein